MSDTTTLQTTLTIDAALARISPVKNFVERRAVEEILDQLIDSASADSQQALRELAYDLLADAADPADLVVSKSRAIDVLLDLRNSGLCA